MLAKNGASKKSNSFLVKIIKNEMNAINILICTRITTVLNSLGLGNAP